MNATPIPYPIDPHPIDAPERGSRRGDRCARPAARAIAALAIAASAAGCAPGHDAGRGSDAADTAAPAPAPPPHAADTVVDTVMVEGMPQPMTLRRFETPPGFALPFATWVPDDLVAEAASSGEGEGVRIVWRDPTPFTRAARIACFVQPAGATRESAAAAARRLAAEGGAAVEPLERPHAFALEGLRFRRPGGARDRVVGWIEVGERDGRFFHLIVEHPAELGDGMSPRVGVVLRRWRWLPAEEPLRL